MISPTKTYLDAVILSHFWASRKCYFWVGVAGEFKTKWNKSKVEDRILQFWVSDTVPGALVKTASTIGNGFTHQHYGVGGGEEPIGVLPAA